MNKLLVISSLEDAEEYHKYHEVQGRSCSDMFDLVIFFQVCTDLLGHCRLTTDKKNIFKNWLKKNVLLKISNEFNTFRQLITVHQLLSWTIKFLPKII